jgi:UDP-N-acetylenolpyruvoylglucosamine reductase
LGEKARAQQASIDWAKQKSSQPKNSLGSVFQNLTPEVQKKLNLPTPSIGYLVEHVLKLSGFRIGDAQIAPTSNNFILNLGNSTASDYIAVVEKVESEAHQQLGIKLKREIFIK